MISITPGIHKNRCVTLHPDGTLTEGIVLGAKRGARLLNRDADDVRNKKWLGLSSVQCPGWEFTDTSLVNLRVREAVLEREDDYDEERHLWLVRPAAEADRSVTVHLANPLQKKWHVSVTSLEETLAPSFYPLCPGTRPLPWLDEETDCLAVDESIFVLGATSARVKLWKPDGTALALGAIPTPFAGSTRLIVYATPAEAFAQQGLTPWPIDGYEAWSRVLGMCKDCGWVI